MKELICPSLLCSLLSGGDDTCGDVDVLKVNGNELKSRKKKKDKKNLNSTNAFHKQVYLHCHCIKEGATSIWIAVVSHIAECIL